MVDGQAKRRCSQAFFALFDKMVSDPKDTMSVDALLMAGATMHG
jgi:hypothetical protein